VSLRLRANELVVIRMSATPAFRQRSLFLSRESSEAVIRAQRNPADASKNWKTLFPSGQNQC
jgi:hypothetical protein